MHREKIRATHNARAVSYSQYTALSTRPIQLEGDIYTNTTIYKQERIHTSKMLIKIRGITLRGDVNGVRETTFVRKVKRLDVLTVPRSDEILYSRLY